MTDAAFRRWRLLHRSGTAVVAFMALAHSILTPFLYSSWGPDALWFLGTGLGLLFLAVANWAHVGLEPCHQPTAPVVLWANLVFLAFGLGALFAVPEVQALAVVIGLALQALAGLFTLRGDEIAKQGET